MAPSLGPLGVMGGFMQPQGHVQVFLALAQGLDPQAALDLPRLLHRGRDSGGLVALEEGLPDALVSDLAARGHTVKTLSGWERALFGRGQVIWRDPLQESCAVVPIRGRMAARWPGYDFCSPCR